MESEMVCDGEISIGPFGGPGGTAFSYKAKHAIKQIVIISNNNYIDSILFKGDAADSATTSDYSKTFGGGFKTGTRTDKIDIDFPSDFLTGVSGTYGSPGQFYIKSLKFYTKLTEYGPFGYATGTSFSFHPKGSLITGFHGRADGCIDSIGFYFKPLSSVFVPIPKKESSELITLRLQNLINKGVLVRSPGPWGGLEGREFDDGVFAEIKKVHVHECGDTNAISAVQFLYVKKDGTTIWSPMHGCLGGDVVKKIEIDVDGGEYLVGIEGFHGPIEGITGDISVMRSITFHTNKFKYGPLGSEIGKFFTSSKGCDGKIVGFFGKSGAYLSAIGVHNVYL
ncbi:hypothetical protein ABFS82_03G059200 [Erythranthe guttata]